MLSLRVHQSLLQRQLILQAVNRPVMSFKFSHALDYSQYVATLLFTHERAIPPCCFAGVIPDSQSSDTKLPTTSSLALCLPAGVSSGVKLVHIKPLLRFSTRLKQ